VSALKICPQCGTEYELDQRFCPKDGSTLKSQNAAGDLVGSIIADRYHVLKKLGEGGMGTVYLAEHVKMGRKSAVKVMNPGMVNDADAISRFNREAANASRINHPNVAAVYDFGETSEGLIYLAMEFVEGPALTNVIKEQGALDPLRAADLTRQAADALAVAHDMGIVHRDLKPDNIMVAKNRDGSDCAKVVDFGIAKAANNEAQKVTKTGLVVGTPEYMSPEQLAGDKMDGRSDIYSLALVAFNMMTGKLPFPAETVQESMIMRLTDKPRQLAEMKPDVPWSGEVQAVLDKALERDAAERYQSASDFGRQLFKAVQNMSGEATKAFTAVMAPPPAGGRKKTPPRSIPGTRVSTATPVSAPAIDPPTRVSTPQASRMPIMAVVGFLLVAVVGVGGYFALNNKSATDNGAAPQGGAANGSVSTPTTPATTQTNVTATLDTVSAWTNFARGADSSTALRALARLDSLSTLAASDTQRVRMDLYRAEAQLVLAALLPQDSPAQKRDLAGACNILKDNEGKFNQFGFGDQVTLYLSGTKTLPPLCPKAQ
jgi:serine/threonine protein kinase